MKAKGTLVACLSTVLVCVPWRVRAEQPQPLSTTKGLTLRQDDASLYADATRAISDGRWQDAVSLFNRVAQLHDGHAEGALYWSAYAQNKEGLSANALGTCAQLREEYPQSRWLEECGALEIEIRGQSGNPVSPQTEPNEDLKLLALNALMQQDQAQAVPILKKILAGNHSEELKSRALFVLAQSGSPQAAALLGQIAQGQSGEALQIRAIRMIAASQGQRAVDMLAGIYQHSTSAEVKREILRSYLITGSSSKLLEVARQETDPELLKTAIRTLAAMGLGPDLLAVYRATGNAEAKADIINALIASGRNGVAPLTEIAQSEQDMELRRKAIRNLGIAGGVSVAPALAAIYRKSPDTDTKRAAAQALFLASDAHDLVALARVEKDPDMKRYLVQQLSLMHDPEATDYMLDILKH